jgi:hypothetical protein
MELCCAPKSQNTTVKHSQQLFEHTYTSNLYSLGTLTPIEFFQQDLLWQSSNTNLHSCSQKASKHVLLSQFPDTNSGFRPKGVHSQTHTHVCTRRFSKLGPVISVEFRRPLKRLCVYCCVRNNAADRPSVWIVAFLRIRHNVQLHCYVTVLTLLRQGNLTHVTIPVFRLTR